MDSTQIYSPRYKSIVERLIEARVNAGLTQAELGQRLGLGQPEISRIENFQRQVTVTELLDWIKETGNSELQPVIELLTMEKHAPR